MNHRFRLAILLFLCGLTSLNSAHNVVRAHDGDLPLQTSVKQLSQPVATPKPMNPAIPEPKVATPTTPSAKLPQYQSGYLQRRVTNFDDSTNPRMRFFLALPRALLLVEATITIDGIPFQMVREQRIERLLKQIGSVKRDDATSESAAAGSNAPTDSALNPVAVTTTADSLMERIRQTISVTGEIPTRDELHWILANWIDGPSLLMLNDNCR